MGNMENNTQLAYRLSTADDIKTEVKQRFNVSLHSSTIRRHRQALGYEASKPQLIPHIREGNKIKRKEFCIQLRATNDSFDDVIFTDESSVQLGQNRRVVMAKVVRDARGKILSKDVPQLQRVKHPLKVHVWGGISRKGATQLLVFNDIMESTFYTDSVLRDTLLPAINHLYPAPATHRLWQDNDPKHTSIKARTFMDSNNINWFKTPAESPDLNMIENVWSAMKHCVGKENPRTQNELVATLLRFWSNHLTVDQCNRYINHIYRVIPKVIAVDGGYSGY